MGIIIPDTVMLGGTRLLLCSFYRPPCQGPGLMEFLTEQLDPLLMRHCSSHVLIVNHHQKQAAYESLLDVQGLTDYVSLPTHIRGGTLDPVITAMQEVAVLWTALTTMLYRPKFS